MKPRSTKRSRGPVISIGSRTRRAGRTQLDEGAAAWAPPVDVYEADDHYVCNAEVPGVEARDIRIEVAGNELSIRGERRFDAVCSEENYQRLEGIRGRFHRSFTLPERLDHRAIRAELRDGVLEVILPKLPRARR